MYQALPPIFRVPGNEAKTLDLRSQKLETKDLGPMYPKFQSCVALHCTVSSKLFDQKKIFAYLQNCILHCISFPSSPPLCLASLAVWIWYVVGTFAATAIQILYFSATIPSVATIILRAAMKSGSYQSTTCSNAHLSWGIWPHFHNNYRSAMCQGTNFGHLVVLSPDPTLTQGETVWWNKSNVLVDVDVIRGSMV